MSTINSNINKEYNEFADFSNIKTYKGIAGWFYSFIGSAIAFEKDNSTIYLDLKSYAFELLKNKNLKFDSLECDSRIQEVLLKTLNPIAGDRVNFEFARTLFNNFREKTIQDQIVNCLTKNEVIEVIKNNLKVLSLKERKIIQIPYKVNLLKLALKPGDILFKTFDSENSSIIASHITFGQRSLFPLLKGKKEREACHISHVSIYIGDGKIAEAAWPPNKDEEVRIIELDNSLVAIQDSKFEYLVTRPQDISLANRTVEVAKRVISTSSKKNATFKLSYSISLAIQSLFCRASFGPKAKEEYVNNYFDYVSYNEDNHQSKKSKSISPRQFFCSYFATYCLQIAEAQKIASFQLDIEKLKQKTVNPDSNHWEKIKTQYSNWKNLQELEKHVKFKLHAKRTTPMNLRNYMVQNQEQFKDLFLISNKTY